MTTIAYRSGQMAADTQCTSSGGAKSRVRKIIRLTDGGLFGGAGDFIAIMALRKWAEVGFEGKRPVKTMDSQCMLVKANGEIWYLAASGEPFELLDEYMAIGSGADYAMGAMAAGKSAEDAVEIAAKHDSMTSGPFHVEKLG